MQTAEFCREIEAYLCKKNDGHLIRVTGPSFDLVAAWAERGVPLNVALAGIDRYFERYYRTGPRRRPVKIDFCEADILDAFDEWRRATGVGRVDSRESIVDSRESGVDSRESIVDSRESAVDSRRPRGSGRRSLADHLERVMLRLTTARVDGRLDAGLDDLIDRVSHELDAARADSRGLRGEARRQLVARLEALDQELVAHARAALTGDARDEIAREADDELAFFRSGMTAEAFARAREAAIDRLVRQRRGLPTIAFR